MTGFVAEIGAKLADRWLQLLVLPGLLWGATLAVAVRLGQEHPFDVDRLRGWLDRLATHANGRGFAAVLLTATAVLLASSAAGLTAGALGGLLQRLWGASGARPPLSWVVRRRHRRWRNINERAERAIARLAHSDRRGGPLVQALMRSDAVRAEHRRAARPPSPRRPTRIGDEFHNAAERVRTLYALDLELAWPRLWALLPDTPRGDVTGAREAYTAAARLTAWGLLYGVLAAAWWPAALLGIGIVATAVVRARASASVLVALVETVVDLYIAALAEKLGVPHDTPSTTEIGRAITSRLSPPR